MPLGRIVMGFSRSFCSIFFSPNSLQLSMSVQGFVDAAKDAMGTCIVTTSIDRIDNAPLRELRRDVSISSREKRKACGSVARSLCVGNLFVVIGKWKENVLEARSGSK
jgi:hypothetical protein